MIESSLQFHGKTLRDYVSKESRSEILRLQRVFRKLSDIEEKYAKELKNLSRSDLDFGKNARPSLRSALGSFRSHLAARSDRHVNFAKTINQTSMIVLEQGVKHCQRLGNSAAMKAASEVRNDFVSSHAKYVKIHRKMVDAERRQEMMSEGNLTTEDMLRLADEASQKKQKKTKVLSDMFRGLMKMTSTPKKKQVNTTKEHDSDDEEILFENEDERNTLASITKTPRSEIEKARAVKIAKARDAIRETCKEAQEKCNIAWDELREMHRKHDDAMSMLLSTMDDFETQRYSFIQASLGCLVEAGETLANGLKSDASVLSEGVKQIDVNSDVLDRVRYLEREVEPTEPSFAEIIPPPKCAQVDKSRRRKLPRQTFPALKSLDNEENDVTTIGLARKILTSQKQEQERDKDMTPRTKSKEHAVVDASHSVVEILVQEFFTAPIEEKNTQTNKKDGEDDVVHVRSAAKVYDQLSRFMDSTECGGNALAEALLMQRGRTSAQLEPKRFDMLEVLVRRTLDEAALRGDLSTVRSIMGLAQTFCLKSEKEIEEENKIFLLHRLRTHSIWQYSAFWMSAIFEAISYERVKFKDIAVSPSKKTAQSKMRNFLTRRKSNPSPTRDPFETEMMTFAVLKVYLSMMCKFGMHRERTMRILRKFCGIYRLKSYGDEWENLESLATTLYGKEEEEEKEEKDDGGDIAVSSV